MWCWSCTFDFRIIQQRLNVTAVELTNAMRKNGFKRTQNLNIEWF